jgi:RecA-family ATPase
MLHRTGHFLYRPSEITDTDSPVEWLWDGYLARKHLTLLTGQWKIGKSTLLAALLARLGAGGELAGRRVRPGRAVVFTEENRGLWQRRIARHRLGDWVSFAFEPFSFRPRPEEWYQLTDDLVWLCYQRWVELVAFDSLSSVLPGRGEADAAAMLDLLRSLRAVAGSGPAVLLTHHPRKGPAAGGQSSRGTGALPASVDFTLELHWAGSAAQESRRRRLLA